MEGTHLHECTVDVGGPETLHIVCGAPNVAAGQLVPVALDGAHLPGGVKIKKGKLRGMISEGMICSGEELHVPTELYPNIEEKGILVFQEDYPLGADVKPILGIDDTAVDFEILANRPDCLCAIGIARETAAALDTEFHAPEITVTEAGGDIHDEVKVRVEAPDLCPRYAARVIKNVRIAPSPLWLRKYLHGAGLRAINNIVDITNYIMIEYGHPMHAFDLSKVRGRQIVVRRAHPGETLTTLDGNERALRTDDLVICDEERATGLAGIMGGEESEITEGTTDVMFECAAFDRTAIRLTSRALGMRTESSGRFERGVAAGTVMDALDRACMLVNLLDAGDVVSGVIDLYPNPRPAQVITASVAHIQERAGVPIPADDMVRILKKLHFGCERDGDTLTVTVPAFREDLDGEADICEECLRIYGYQHIPATPLSGQTTQGGVSPMKALKDRAARLLTGMGYLEVMNFSFTGIKEIQKLGLPEGDLRNDPMPILNPLGEDAAVMRPTLACGMLHTLAFNMNHSTPAARLYEMAAVFDHHHRTDEGLPTETQTLCLGAYGPGGGLLHRARRGGGHSARGRHRLRGGGRRRRVLSSGPLRAPGARRRDLRHRGRGASRRARALRPAQACRDGRNQPANRSWSLLPAHGRNEAPAALPGRGARPGAGHGRGRGRGPADGRYAQGRRQAAGEHGDVRCVPWRAGGRGPQERGLLADLPRA